MLKNSCHTEKAEAGCDEAGRGCLAGPVIAAAVILPPGYVNPILNDSKKLSAVKREQLRLEIKDVALAWGVGSASPGEIDRMNILNASILAMHRAIGQLSVIPQHILVDGNRFTPYGNIPHTCIIGGDSLYMNIAAASVLAKTFRDDIMRNLHDDYPQYGWASNKGYPTNSHIGAVKEHGLSPWHRKSFHIRPKQAKIDFDIAKGG